MLSLLAADVPAVWHGYSGKAERCRAAKGCAAYGTWTYAHCFFRTQAEGSAYS